eukprot:8325291-Pyramimonas_sp.AAC.1
MAGRRQRLDRRGPRQGPGSLLRRCRGPEPPRCRRGQCRTNAILLTLTSCLGFPLPRPLRCRRRGRQRTAAPASPRAAGSPGSPARR